MKTVLAIDPGKTGAIAVRRADGGISSHKMPPSSQEMVLFFQEILKEGVAVEAFVEQLNAGSAAQGPRKGVKTIWSQATNYTAIITALFAAEIPTSEISPAKWMGRIKGHGKRPAEYADRKAWLYSYALKRFPHIKFPKYAGDAFALLDVCEAE